MLEKSERSLMILKVLKIFKTNIPSGNLTWLLKIVIYSGFSD